MRKFIYIEYQSILYSHNSLVPIERSAWLVSYMGKNYARRFRPVLDLYLIRESLTLGGLDRCLTCILYGKVWRSVV